MSDPLRTDPSRAAEPAADVDRDAKIEQLLLAGLDHYFSARYEQAINVWTRALFLDRSHARARAYIERARSALAERQRESEELLQNGVDAFGRGEGGEARRLLQAAISQGAPPDQALAVLDRLNRLEQGSPVNTPAPARTRTRPAPGAHRQFGGSRAAWVALALLVLVIIVATAFGAGAFRSDWRSLLQQRPAPSPVAPFRTTADGAPSLPRRGEMALARAQTLVSSGRLRDALAALDGVRATDPQRPDADRLKTEIQKQLIQLAVPSGGAEARGDTPAP